MALNLGVVTAKSYLYLIPEDATAADLNADFLAAFGEFMGYDENSNLVVLDRFTQDQDGNLWANDEMGFVHPMERSSYLVLGAAGGGFYNGMTMAQVEAFYYVLEAPTS